MSRSDALVLFGATGDLARKKLFSSLYRLAARGRLDLPVIGVALSDWDSDQFRAHVREAIAATVADADTDVVDRLCQRLSLIGGGVVCSNCRAGLDSLIPLAPATLALMNQLMTRDMAAISSLDLNQALSSEVLSIAFRFSEAFLERPLRSRGIVFGYLEGRREGS